MAWTADMVCSWGFSPKHHRNPGHRWLVWFSTETVKKFAPVNDDVTQTLERVTHSHEKPLHSSSTDVDIFFSLILSYFCFFVAARSPCHGRLPRRRYIMMYAMDSTSSRRLCSINHKTVHKNSLLHNTYISRDRTVFGIVTGLTLVSTAYDMIR